MSNGRVDGGVTTVAPHRSGRVRLTHPAPQLITFAGLVVVSFTAGSAYRFNSFATRSQSSRCRCDRRLNHFTQTA